MLRTSTYILIGYKYSAHNQKVVFHLSLVSRETDLATELIQDFRLWLKPLHLDIGSKPVITEITERRVNRVEIILCSQFQELV